ncbi:hypothetical protein [Rhizobium sp. AN80A]|uniref:hypothetical protein n=1 Tax=Rhizobium sp. AN80A TaxID=3040673 RepID=UPI0024B3BD75|nr:hypothetical protein [Rhizobium sp. AN80A]
MGLVQNAMQIWRDFVADGIPSSGPWKPKKSEIRTWGTWIETFISSIGTNSGSVYTSRAQLFANLKPDDKAMAWVISDPTAAYSGIYQKAGATNSGSWIRVGDLPYSFIIATDVGAGTPNAIQATSAIPISESALVWFRLFEPNGPGAVTVSFNGDAPLTIKTIGGNDPIPGGIVGLVMGVKIGSTFQLVTDQSSASIQAAAEAAATAAANYAALARNDVVVNAFAGDGSTTDFPLTVDPGSANNIRVNMNGAGQLHSSYSLVYVSGAPKLRFSEAPPDGVAIEAEMGFRIAVGSPATGSITYDKIQNITATLRLLGRKTAGAGVTEEISPAELRDLFFPAGSVIQSVSATPYTTSADLSANIPIDDTIPQITEGTQILTVDVTPKAANSKLRIRFTGNVAAKAVAQPIAYAIFNGGANAIKAGYIAIADSGHGANLTGEVEYSPGVTTTQTISVRVGAGSGSIRMNGSSAARLFGGVSASTLIVEEIKV